MSTDIFVKIDGIKGESKGKGHEKEIDVLAWSFGVSQSGSFGQGGGGGSGKANVQDLTFTKHIDSASSDLMLATFCGKHIPEVVFTMQKAGENPLVYMKITLTNVIVTNHITGGTPGEERPTENISLNFEKIKYEYDSQNEKGGKGEHYQMGWNVSQNTKL